MHLIYVDESGNTGTFKDPNQPIHLLAGLIVHESKIRAIETAVSEIAYRRFDMRALLPNFEFHGADLYSGNGIFKGVAPAERISAIHEIMDVLLAQEAKVIWCAADKFRMWTSRHPHQLCFLFLAERVEDFLRNIDSLGLFVADENKEVEQRLIEDLEVYKTGTTGFGYRPTRVHQIVDSLHFVQSVNNRLIQCVDLIAYFALKEHRQSAALLEQFMALPAPKPTWPAWRTATMTPKQQAVYDIGQKVQLITSVSKVFPT